MKDYIKDILVLSSALGSGLLVAMTALAVFANWSPTVSLFAQLHMHILLCAVFAFFVFLFYRRTFGIWVASLLILLNTYPIALAASRTAPTVAPSASNSAKPIKLMWANLWIRNHEIEKIMAEVKRVNPDILIFSEVSHIHAPLGKLLKPTYPYQAPLTKDRKPGYLFIASKFPLSGTKALHATRSSDRPPLVTTKLTIDGKPLTLVATHLYWPMNGARKKRAVMWLSHYINELKGPIMIAGDFNFAPFSPAMRHLEDNAHVKRFGLFERSWPTSMVQAIPMAQVLIDHILKRDGANTRINKLSHTIGNDIGSDHYPVVTEFIVTKK